MVSYVCDIAPTYNNDVVAHFADLAGDDFLWKDARGVTMAQRQSAKFVRLMRDDMAERQGYVCPVCALGFTQADMDELRVEANHGTCQGANRGGWFVGNVWVGHKKCNADTAPTFKDGELVGGKAILTADDLKAPEVVPMEWTPLPTLKRRAGYLPSK